MLFQSRVWLLDAWLLVQDVIGSGGSPHLSLHSQEFYDRPGVFDALSFDVVCSTICTKGRASGPVYQSTTDQRPTPEVGKPKCVMTSFKDWDG